MTVPRPTYAPQGHPQQPVNPTRANWMGGVALGSGLGALALGILTGVTASPVLVTATLGLGVPGMILAIVLGSMGMGRARRGEATNRAVAVAGLVVGIIDVVLVLALFLLFVFWVLAVSFSYL